MTIVQKVLSHAERARKHKHLLLVYGASKKDKAAILKKFEKMNILIINGASEDSRDPISIKIFSSLSDKGVMAKNKTVQAKKLLLDTEKTLVVDNTDHIRIFGITYLADIFEAGIPVILFMDKQFVDNIKDHKIYKDNVTIELDLTQLKN